MVLASLTMGEEFFVNEGLSLAGQFLIWLDEHGPAQSKDLSRFPGWSRGRKAERQPVLDVLLGGGYIEIGRHYSGRAGHPPILHTITQRGTDWAEILRNTSWPTEDPEHSLELEVRVAALEAVVASMASRISALEHVEWTLQKVG